MSARRATIAARPSERNLGADALTAAGSAKVTPEKDPPQSRIGPAPTSKVDGSHVIMISHPQAVTDHILNAARAVADAHR
jgi:hypothetical protein